MLGVVCAQRCVVLIGNLILRSNGRIYRLDVIWLHDAATVAVRFKFQRLSTPHVIVTAVCPCDVAQHTAVHVSVTPSVS